MNPPKSRVGLLIAVAVTLVAIVVSVWMIIGGGGDRGPSCEERGGVLVCPYKSPCKCFDRSVFK